ncbi:hypothetical protein ONE63_006183 [Megalurothrips usitatus]|uniref:TUG ubiquitin-like domain-containing protein n=1 Tax=Megalurothrips usitatus TaxID=439358 RepID=A0AAV7XTL9_9NEOP|nr:hypothetical protein ONE63_006183 [Megalurothrips usitatus]
MSNKCVVVLAPNGRRQNVKVTPNTTILQVLEEVCRKQGFKPEEYDIKHHNKILDATSIMRYTGLPNNAQLEMSAALRTRAETRVKVGLALESGNRVMGEFEPSDTLWNVVGKLCPDEVDTEVSAETLPVIFYLGREECGKENLERTTLRCLGLTSGGGILRFFRKAPGDLNQQANVSAPLTRSIPAQESLAKLQASFVPLSKAPNELNSKNSEKEYPSVSTINQQSGACVPMQTEESEPVLHLQPPVADEPRNESVPSVVPSEKQESNSEDMKMDYESSSDTPQLSMASSSTPSICEPPVKFPIKDEPQETIVFLGERNAVLFDAATAQACKPEDVPDDFFDLTVDDAKQLLRDLKRRQAALEQQPLVTSQYRELEKSKQMLSALHQYKRCVIKVQFPNQLVLQGTFTPLEKVSHVMDFIRKYLQDGAVDFHIFTVPPKTILLPEQTLYEANCVPGALVHFLSSTPCPESGSYIRDDVMAQACTASAAAAAAAGTTRRTKTMDLGDPDLDAPPPDTGLFVAQASTPSAEPRTAPRPVNSNEAGCKKVPKWFKTSK